MVKFTDESPEESTEDTPVVTHIDPPESEDKTPPVAPERPEDPSQATPEDVPGDESMIVYRERVVEPDGTVGEKLHGPMPRADWPAYEKEHGL